MSRLTATLQDEEERIVEENTGDGTEFSSKSEFVRRCIQSYERVQQVEADLEDARDEIEDLRRRAERVDDLEREVERLKNEKQALIEDRDERQELRRYVDEERSYRQTGLVTRVKWWLTGMPEKVEST